MARGGGRHGGRSANQVSFSCSAQAVFSDLTPAGETAPLAPAVAAVAAAVVANPNAWVLDSGASHHMAKDRDQIYDYEATPGVMVKTADCIIAPAEGKGTMKITTSRGTTMVLKNTLYVPSLLHNLLSIRTITRNGGKVAFDDKRCVTRKEGRIVSTAWIVDTNQYVLNQLWQY